MEKKGYALKSLKPSIHRIYLGERKTADENLLGAFPILKSALYFAKKKSITRPCDRKHYVLTFSTCQQWKQGTPYTLLNIVFLLT